MNKIFVASLENHDVYLVSNEHVSFYLNIMKERVRTNITSPYSNTECILFDVIAWIWYPNIEISLKNVLCNIETIQTKDIIKINITSITFNTIFLTLFPSFYSNKMINFFNIQN